MPMPVAVASRAWLTPACFCTRLSKVPAARSRSACRISGLRHSRSGMLTGPYLPAISR
jgi:hypothetical protein